MIEMRSQRGWGNMNAIGELDKCHPVDLLVVLCLEKHKHSLAEHHL